jgi:hypothetical protein
MARLALRCAGRELVAVCHRPKSSHRDALQPLTDGHGPGSMPFVRVLAAHRSVCDHLGVSGNTRMEEAVRLIPTEMVRIYVK